MPKPRNYEKEYRDFHGKPEQIRRRAARNKARSLLGLKQGDGKEVDHKKPLSKGGSNGKKNLRKVSRSANRKKGAKNAS
jgi:5-methylcytosine-specific restriction endonuclease McrA|tara:strand:+ start:78 stop:314 length:237 start_codon:yes stop_codon:yes gene_type:complete